MEALVTAVIALIFLAASLGQLAIVTGSGDVKIYVSDIISLVFVCFSLVYLLNIKRKLVLPSRILLALAFCFFALITLIFGLRSISLSETFVSGMYLLRLVIYVALSAILGWYVVVFKNLRTRILWFMVLSALLVCIFGLIQLYLLPNLSDLPAELGWDPHRGRLVSTFFDPNFTGGYIVLGVITSLVLLTKNSKSLLKGLLVVGILLMILSLILTFSRSSWLMFSVVVFVYGLFRSRKLLIVTFALMFLTYFLVPRAQTRLSGTTDPNDSAKYRVASWRNTLRVAKDNLPVGIGFNTYRYAQQRYGFFDYQDESGGHAGSGSDSSLLLVLATTGVFGAGLFVITYFDIVKYHLLRCVRKKDVLSLAVTVSIVGLFVHSNFVNSIFYPQYLLWFWSLFAVSYEGS